MSTSHRLHWGHSTIETACPLDCPDNCAVDVTVEDARILRIDGARRTPTTGGYVCAKVRDFAAHVYCEERVKFPMVRTGPKGRGVFQRVSWEEALERVATEIERARDRWGGESILPYHYGGSNGLLTQDSVDAEFFRQLGTSRISRTLCAAATGAAAQAMYGKMAGVGYEDYADAQLIVIWGANPSASGIHLVPYIKQARQRGAALVVIDPRSTKLARLADLHLPVRPGTDLPVALAVIDQLFASGCADEAFLAAHTTGAGALRACAAQWPIERAAAVAQVDATALRRFAEMYAERSPALVRCGWGLERNRNGGNAVLAVLALPAVAGKFGVRGGGFTLSNSAAYGLAHKPWLATPEPNTRLFNMNLLGRILCGPVDPPVKVLFVYNANPAATVPDQQQVLRGLAREDLFTVVYDQVMTDSARYADVVLPATTFLEHYDISRGYGAYSMQLVKPVIEPVGESRPNAEVFGRLASRLTITATDEEDEAEALVLLRVADALPAHYREPLLDGRTALPPWGSRPIQFVDVYPNTPDRKVRLFPEEVAADAPAGLYGYQPDPATRDHPLALISPASEKTISSTLGQLRTRPASLAIHPEDAATRGIEDGDTVRVFNALGEVHCHADVTPAVAPGTVSLPKGLWTGSTLNGATANTLAPDSLTDLGGGACFNDARVQVARMLEAGYGDTPVSLFVVTEKPKPH
jgi:anaerobic selenocysteine-containing dehydrogenase